MTGKLAFRNMKRSAKDYLVYILTMTVVAALMYAFSSLIFQNELAGYFDTVDMLGAMIGVATVFIVLIVAWLINYMVRFMLEKRSSEFGIYLLLGMKKKVISRLYFKENLLMGGVAFGFGIIFGILLRQVLMAIMFSMMRMEYRLHITFHWGTFLMSILCYMGCYLLALLRCGRRFRKMNIYALMNAKRQNEEIGEKHEEAKRVFLPMAVSFIFVFWTLFGAITNGARLILFLIGLVLTIYLFYVGLSAWIICYVRRKGNGIYRGQNLFLLRQFASKIRTMQFTMGTLSALFTLALMGVSCALMLSDYENTALEGKFPFDVQIYSSDVEYDFADEIELLCNTTELLEIYSYHIYTDGDDQVNTWMLTHLAAWGTMWQNADGSPDMAEIREMLRTWDAYCVSDTYMGLSDYNHLRQMLGYEKVELGADEYVVQVSPRLSEEVEGIGDDLRIAGVSGEVSLSCAGVHAEPFSQEGHNGGDYVIVVPDEVLERMRPYYSELAVDIAGSAPAQLMQWLNELPGREYYTLEAVSEYVKKENHCSGSDTFVHYGAGANCLVRDDLIPEAKYTLSAIIIPFFYIGLVFACVAMTVLSVQQVSDSAKYQFRYDVLTKLGLSRGQIRSVVGKQLAAYYLCPALLAIVISGKMILFLSRRFVFITGTSAFGGEYFVQSILLFFGIYLMYLVVTYVGFVRNVEESH